MANAAKVSDGSERFELFVLGPGAVGKSSLTCRFLSGEFFDEYTPTIEDYFKKPLNIDGHHVILQIYDTAGQQEFKAMQDEYYRNGEGFLMVYSITSMNTFKEIQSTYKKLMACRDIDELSPPSIILAGNKCDLKESREVPAEEGKKLAKQWDCVFYETSAKEQINNLIIFEQAVREKWRIDKKHPRKKGANGGDNPGGKCCIML